MFLLCDLFVSFNAASCRTPNKAFYMDPLILTLMFREMPLFLALIPEQACSRNFLEKSWSQNVPSSWSWNIPGRAVLRIFLNASWGQKKEKRLAMEAKTELQRCRSTFSFVLASCLVLEAILRVFLEKKNE